MKGAGTYVPTARFAFPRSYVNDFWLYQNGDTFVQTANTLVVHDVPPSVVTATFIIDARFYVWSSNKWTLDFIITDSFYTPTPGGPSFPLPLNLDYKIDPTTGRGGLFLGWAGFQSDPAKIVWPPAPANYWLPKPLP